MKDFKGKFALLLFTLLLVHLIALKGQAPALDDFDTKATTRFSKEYCVTDPNLGNTLQSALAYLGSTVCKLHYRAPEAIKANLSIPANITLAPDAGAVLTVAPGVTLTIHGGLDAKPYQIFSCRAVWSGTRVPRQAARQAGYAPPRELLAPSTAARPRGAL